MTFPDWVLGVLFQPADTYEKARRELRFGYWWILLSVLTLEVVATLWGPAARDPFISTGDIVIYITVVLMLLFDLQAVLLLGASRLFGVILPWIECLQFIGLTWSVMLVEDLIGFYWALKGDVTLVFWTGLPFFVWYVVALASGLRRVAQLSVGKAYAVALLASLPWRAGLAAMYWFASKA